MNEPLFLCNKIINDIKYCLLCYYIYMPNEKARRKTPLKRTYVINPS